MAQKWEENWAILTIGMIVGGGIVYATQPATHKPVYLLANLLLILAVAGAIHLIVELCSRKRNKQTDV